MTDIFPHLEYKPKLPQRLDHGIGIVGAGGIVNYAHLPAYKKAGFRVVGITDRNREQAERSRQSVPPKNMELRKSMAASKSYCVSRKSRSLT